MKLFKNGSVYRCIGFDRMTDDGICVKGKMFSKCYSFKDINYAMLSAKDREKYFLLWSSVINGAGDGISIKITVSGKSVPEYEIEKNMKMRDAGDNLDKYRKDFNERIGGVCLSADAAKTERFLTVTARASDTDEARGIFLSYENTVMPVFREMGSELCPLSLTERVKSLAGFFGSFNEGEPFPDIRNELKKGHDIRDMILPDSVKIRRDCLEMSGRFYRFAYIKEYAAYLKDTLLMRICSAARDVAVSMDLRPVDPAKALKDARNRLLGIETDIANWQRRQNLAENYSAVIPFELEQRRNEMREFLNDLSVRDQRMFLGLCTVCVSGSTREELEERYGAVKAEVSREMCSMGILEFMQEQSPKTVFPVMTQDTGINRTLTTESASVFIPFKSMEVRDKDGAFWGINPVTKSIITVNRRQHQNGNVFILGVSGSGKSFMAKYDILQNRLNKDADIIIIDPEREYSELVNALGGKTVYISPASQNYINPMGINEYYGDEVNPVIMKSEFIMSLFEQLSEKKSLGYIEKSIIDRCVRNVYSEYVKNRFKGRCPVLKDLMDELLRQEEKEAAELALSIELFAKGSFDVFSHESELSGDSSLLCYDIKDMGKQLETVAMLTVLDSVFNRITKNRYANRDTYIYIDEIYLLFRNSYSASFLFGLWKRVRKYRAFATGITQNAEDLLESGIARAMLANSEIIMMLNQAPTDREKLASLLNIPDAEKKYITDSRPGTGLLRVGASVVPFENVMEEKGLIYPLLVTGVKAGG